MKSSQVEVAGLLFLFMTTIVCRPSSISRDTTTALQSQRAAQETFDKESIRHGRKKKMKNDAGTRGKKKVLRHHFEKQYLVHNRTLALLGDDVLRILHTSKNLWSDTGVKPPPPGGGRKNRPLRKHLRKTMLGVGNQRKLNKPVDAMNIFNIGNKDDDDDSQINTTPVLNQVIVAIDNQSEADALKPLLDSANPCQKWIDCKKDLQNVFLGPLPSCPCHYPTSIFYEDKIWDEVQQRHFRWKDASGDIERLDVHKPGAEYCIRSIVTHESVSLAAQHCCYDRGRRLITRGSGAATPNLVSPDVSSVLHEKLDVLPWRLCKGDFTRYNKVRAPNNGNSCQVNPNDKEYNEQVKIATSY